MGIYGIIYRWKSKTYNYRILGDATGELGPFWSSGGFYQSTWFADYANLVGPTNPWFTRGGYYYCGPTRAGQFGFGRGGGEAFSDGGSRVILKP